MVSHGRHENFSPTVWITWYWRGTTSSVSVMSSPILETLPPQHGQALGLGSTRRQQRQIRRQRPAHRPPAGNAPDLSLAGGLAGLGGCGFRRARLFGGGCLQLFELQFQLVEQPAPAFRALAEPVAPEFGDFQPQMLNHRLGADGTGFGKSRFRLGRGQSGAQAFDGFGRGLGWRRRAHGPR